MPYCLDRSVFNHENDDEKKQRNAGSMNLSGALALSQNAGSHVFNHESDDEEIQRDAGSMNLGH